MTLIRELNDFARDLSSLNWYKNRVIFVWAPLTLIQATVIFFVMPSGALGFFIYGVLMIVCTFIVNPVIANHVAKKLIKDKYLTQMTSRARKRSR